MASWDGGKIRQNPAGVDSMMVVALALSNRKDAELLALLRRSAMGFLSENRNAIMTGTLKLDGGDEHSAKQKLLGLFELQDNPIMMEVAEQCTLDGFFLFCLQNALTPGFWICHLELHALCEILNIRMALQLSQKCNKAEARFNLNITLS